MNDPISLTKAASLIGVHPNTIKKWFDRNEGPPRHYIESSNSFHYKRSEVMAWKEANPDGPPRKPRQGRPRT